MNFRKVIAIIAVFAFISAAIASAQINYTLTIQSSGVISQNRNSLQYLHTSGKYLVDQNNQVVQLRGEAWSELVDAWRWDTAWRPADRAAFTASKGANIVALKFAVCRAWQYADNPPYNDANPMSGGWYKPDVLNELALAVDELNKNGVYSFIVPHITNENYPFSGYPPDSSYNWIYTKGHWQDYVNWLVSIFNDPRFSSKPGFLGIYFWNEPDQNPPAFVDQYYAAIRSWVPQMKAAADAKGRPVVSIFSAAGYGGVPQNASTLVPPSLGNIMWAFHHYYFLMDSYASHFSTYTQAQSASGSQEQTLLTQAREQYKQFLITTRNLNQTQVPVIDDEFGYYGRNAPTVGVTEPCYNKLYGPMEAELSIYDELGVYWTYFVGGPQGGVSYGLWDITYDYNTGNRVVTPSDKGQVWLDHLARYQPPPPPPPPPSGGGFNWTQVLSTGFESSQGYPLGQRYVWQVGTPRAPDFPAQPDVSDINGAYIQVVNNQFHGGTQAVYHYAPHGNPQDPQNTETWSLFIWVDGGGSHIKGIRVNFWVRFETLPSNYYVPFYFNNITSYQQLMQLRLFANGNLGLAYLYMYPDQTLTHVETNRWYNVELWYVIDATAGAMGASVDGTTFWSVSNVDTTQLPIRPMGFEFGLYNPSQTQNYGLWTDDMKVSVTQ